MLKPRPGFRERRTTSAAGAGAIPADSEPEEVPSPTPASGRVKWLSRALWAQARAIAEKARKRFPRLLVPSGLADLIALFGVALILVNVWLGCMALNHGTAFSDSDPIISTMVNALPPALYGRVIPGTTNTAGFAGPESAELKDLGGNPSGCQAYDEQQYLLHAFACYLKAMPHESHSAGWYVVFFFDDRFIGREAWSPSGWVYLDGRTGSEITVFFEIYENSQYKSDTGESRSVTYRLQDDGDCPKKAVDPNTCMTPEQDIPALATANSPGR